MCVGPEFPPIDQCIPPPVAGAAKKKTVYQVQGMNTFVLQFTM